MSLDFEEYAFKGMEFVFLVKDELKVTQYSGGRIIRTVFHALRNRISHEESFRLLSYLPVSLKGVYVDGWQYKREYLPSPQSINFLGELRLVDDGLAGYDFENTAKANAAVRTVFKTLHYFVDEEEMKSIVDILPPEVGKPVKKILSGDSIIF